MPRIPHYIPRNHSNESPANCVWLDTETRPRRQPDGTEKHYLWFGFACYQRREKGRQWSEPQWLRFTTRAEFWDWIESLTRPKTRLYLFAHNGGFDLPVLGAFSELPRRGWAMKSAVVDAPPMIITWRKEGRAMRFVDTLNIWRIPLAKLAESVGLEKLPMPGKRASRAKWDAYGRNDTEIIRQACHRWFDFLAENDLGGFAPTLASQAFNSYRHRFMPVPLLADANDKALEISRAAYLGGRTECFRLGRYQGEFYYLDVNSMYPAVMRTGQFPYRLVGYYTRPTKREAEVWTDQDACIMDVTIRTDQPIYPVVHDGKLVFPTGTFRCVLATPDLRCALERGHIIHRHAAAVYEKAEIFREFIDYFYRQRQQAKAAGDTTRAFLYKIMMNSLYGKFGQRGRRYEDAGEAEIDSVRVWDELDLDSGEIAHYREFGGVLQEWINEGESRHSFPAIAAHVTAAARQVLWSAIELAGLRNVYYCDTDSLIVNRLGYRRLQHLIDPDELGAWKLEQTVSNMELHGPKDYVLDEVRKVKGVRARAKWLDGSTVEQDRFTGFRGLLRAGSLDAPIVATQVKHLNRRYTKGRVMKSGRVLPLRLTA